MKRYFSVVPLPVINAAGELEYTHTTVEHALPDDHAAEELSAAVVKLEAATLAAHRAALTDAARAAIDTQTHALAQARAQQDAAEDASA